MKRPFVLLLAVGLLFSGWGCRGAKKPEIAPELATSDEALFKEGQRYIKKDPERARLYFRQIIDSFPRSFYAQRAQLAIGDSYFGQGDEGSMILAATEYRQFNALFPTSPSAPYAQHQIALSFYKKILKPGRTQEKTVQALAEFKRVITLYPQTQEAEDSRLKIKDCEERLAEHTLGIALHYFRNKAVKAASTRLTEILTSYPFFSRLDEVYYYLGESFFIWGKFDQAGPYYTKLVTDHPESKLAKEAQDRLKEIESLKARPPQPAPKKK
jgi:outer membrane protein assembly factor BamD